MSSTPSLPPNADLFATMASCRAMRRLRSDPVPDHLVRLLVRAATFAPSGRNLQRARWIVLRDQEQAIIPSGYPVGNFGEVSRRPVDEVMMYDRWSDGCNG